VPLIVNTSGLPNCFSLPSDASICARKKQQGALH